MATMPKAFDRSQKEFTSGSLQLVLRFSTDELRQRDLERLMGAMRRSDLGDTAAEHSGKVLRAAVEAGWIVSPVWSITAPADDIGDLAPGAARWYASQVDQVYGESFAIPLA